MAYETVTCEVRWVASVGFSGNELPPTSYDILGEFETEGDAARALAEEGLTRGVFGWYGPYSYGSIQRVLREVK